MVNLEYTFFNHQCIIQTQSKNIILTIMEVEL